MPRGAQVIYPKDLGPILMMADIFPGARVLEAGVGSGALSMTAAAGRGRHRRLRAAAGLRQPGQEQRGRVPRCRGGEPVPHRGPGCLRRHRRGRASTGSCSTSPSPGGWSRPPRPHCVAGGILLSYLPSIVQVAQLRETLDHSGFGMVETIEVLQRSWHVEGQSVRPDHRMVAHTGFLTAARLLRVPRREAEPAAATDACE